jgi:Phage phiEco32-like COOH.NH2 ligase-type 2
MKFREQHEAFKRLVIQQGISRLEQLEQALPFGCTVPKEKIDRWLDRLLAVPTDFCCQRRYVNRFKLGADPEFVFVHEGERQDARNLNLQQGLAFGMDNNGRLTEIRPYPSRSAIAVTASILATLRWLAILQPKTLLYNWCAGAFLYGDGLGGHVHFGRKRPGRDLEIKALDAIEEELLAIRAYPVDEVLRRRQGDAHRQYYGQLGDFRKQMHGYEYRTFPSWLDSPELAFLTLTLSKLAVHNPGLAHGYMPLESAYRHAQRVRNLLSYYKDVDDDARVALGMVTRKFPAHIGGDFKARWGIGNLPLAAGQQISFVPCSIKPSEEDKQEMFQYLLGKTPLLNRVPTPTWGPLAPLPGYKMVIDQTGTYGAKGLGELVWDVCCHEKATYPFVNSRDLRPNQFFSIPDKLAATLPSGWQKFCDNTIVRQGGNDKYIYSCEKARIDSFSECRRILLETVLPFWRISELKSDSYGQWRSALRTKAKKKFVGELLYGDLDSLPAKF